MQSRIFHSQLLWLLLLTLHGEYNPTAASTSCAISIQCTQTQTTTLLPIVERVFVRKKRFLLLPPGGLIKFTANFSKRLLSKYPRGMNFAYEAATYYESITKRSDWLPKFLHERTTTTPKPLRPTKPLYVYIPGSLLRYRAKPAVKPSKVHRMDADVSALQWIDGKHAAPGNWSKYVKYNGLGDQQYHYRLVPPNGSWSHLRSQQQRWLPREENQIYAPTSNSKDLRHYNGQRERRHLFRSLESFSNIFAVNMTACILRTICDCQSLLMPTGYSMIQDMLRVIFTMPMHHSIKDEYGHAMSGGNADVCIQDLKQKCPISLITWFLNPEQSI